MSKDCEKKKKYPEENIVSIHSHWRFSERKAILRNFAKFTGKHLSQSLFFSKAAGLRPATLFKKTVWLRCFLVSCAKI